jgi:hypothetical protein
MQPGIYGAANKGEELNSSLNETPIKVASFKQIKKFRYRPEQAQRLVRGIALHFLDLRSRRG